ncbi:MAG: hypothetical protein JKP90_00395 [Desulfofustis sp. PB-SRB1]|nr:hypothetical protein [Desulfofustis sp. PB-SRB1]
MHGFPLNTTKKLMQRLLGGLRAEDSFNVLLFAGTGSISWPLPHCRPPPRRSTGRLTFINDQDGGGGTKLLTAMRRAMALPRAEACHVRW